MIRRPWTRVAAEGCISVVGKDSWPLVEQIQAAIEDVCPFKPDIAYMPVPRCDQCGHWAPHVADKESGSCLLMYRPSSKLWPDLYEGINTTADFGCVEWEAKG